MKRRHHNHDVQRFCEISGIGPTQANRLMFGIHLVLESPSDTETEVNLARVEQYARYLGFVTSWSDFETFGMTISKDGIDWVVSKDSIDWVVVCR